MEDKASGLKMIVMNGGIVIRVRGLTEACSLCEGEIEIFDEESARAKFLIVRLADRLSLGGGKCPHCLTYVCITCAAQTVYGAGMRRLHCPECGRFLVGLQRGSDDQNNVGAFLMEPPEFRGQGNQSGASQTSQGADDSVSSEETL